jgi:hypothetical protein
MASLKFHTSANPGVLQSVCIPGFTNGDASIFCSPSGAKKIIEGRKSETARLFNVRARHSAARVHGLQFGGYFIAPWLQQGFSFFMCVENLTYEGCLPFTHIRNV